jgi:hypothetical protein
MRDRSSGACRSQPNAASASAASAACASADADDDASAANASDAAPAAAAAAATLAAPAAASARAHASHAPTAASPPGNGCERKGKARFFVPIMSASIRHRFCARAHLCPSSMMPLRAFSLEARVACLVCVRQQHDVQRAEAGRLRAAQQRRRSRLNEAQKTQNGQMRKCRNEREFAQMRDRICARLIPLPR